MFVERQLYSKVTANFHQTKVKFGKSFKVCLAIATHDTYNISEAGATYFIKVFQNSQENTSDGILFVIKLQAITFYPLFFSGLSSFLNKKVHIVGSYTIFT